MKNFKHYNSEAKEKESKKDSKAKDAEKQEPMSEVGDWQKTNFGWVVRFKVNGSEYVISFSPIDDAEQHFKFTYFKHGQRDSSAIDKFGPVSDWPAIWAALIDIIKDFIRIFKGVKTLKFIGMSISKRGIYYRNLFKLYVKDYRYSFRRLGYYSTFDTRDLQQAPSFVVKKGDLKEPEEKKEPEKEVKEKE